MPLFLFFVRLYNRKKAADEWNRRRLIRQQEKKDGLVFKQKKERESKRWAVKKGDQFFGQLTFYEARALRRELNFNAEIWHKKHSHLSYQKIKLD